MIARLIDSVIRNRALVILVTVFVVGAGVWSVYNINIDAIPDLSDVQVVIRAEYPGQAPQIVEDQITYPLTTAMLAVPYAKVVRGYSMFGTSFVYIIFEDGTDMYWARSRVLEQLNWVAGSLPPNVSPQIGPDATGVGWVFEYVLTTGKYCPNHAKEGMWHDPIAGRWYATRSEAPQDRELQARLVHYRVFPDDKVVFVDPETARRYTDPDLAPEAIRSRLERRVLRKGYTQCPIDGQALESSDLDLSDLRGLQDWYLRYELTAVDGVSEVASLGGFVKQYQVVVDPVKLLAYNLPVYTVSQAIQESNLDVGGRLIEMAETEYMVRGLGYLGTLSDEELADAQARGVLPEEARTERVLEELRKVSLGATEEGTPIYLADVAEVRVGPDIRRGVAEWNGEGEIVGGIIVMRFGENARATIQNVKERLRELEKGLPAGVAIDVAYDRSDLINRAVNTLSHTLIEEITIVTIVMILFLLHARSALVAAFVLPTGVLASLLIMYLLDINANIMSLGGIAIAIGVMVDSSIVMVENAHKHLETEQRRIAEGKLPRPRAQIIGEAAREVGPSLFFALLIITVSFLPVFALGEQSGRLFKPLAYTKTFSMALSALLAVTIIPVLMVYFISERVVPREWSRRRRVSTYLGMIVLPALILATLPLGALSDERWWLVAAWPVFAALMMTPQKITQEERLPISRFLHWIYRPAFALVMRLRWVVLGVVLLLVVVTIWPFRQLGSEFMPPLEEGDLLYMPSADPGISVDKATEVLQQTDKLIAQFPEVRRVFGKLGRAETATDPAPPPMLETTITLERDKSKWRQVPEERFFSGWPGWLKTPLAAIWPETRPITVDELVYGYTVPAGDGGSRRIPGLQDSVTFPGLTNAWTMPIKTRIDMLSTGIKTPVGIKLIGPNLSTLAELSRKIAQVVRTDDRVAPYTTSAFPEKSVGGNYLDIKINRDEIARYGLTVKKVQTVIMSAVGGMNISFTIEGLERYPVNLRYPQELRDNLPMLKQTLVATPLGAQVPLSQLAEFRIRKGPPQIKTENARLTSWVYVDIAGIDVGTYVKNAQAAIADQVEMPPGYTILWSGQYEYMEAARRRLLIVAPIAALLIILLLYGATRSWPRVAMVLLAIPLSLVGSFWLLWILNYNLSVAVWVGVIALAGLDAEMGLVLLLYLDLSVERFRAERRLRHPNDLWYAVYEGAVERVRPITMTTLTSFIALLPLLWGTGAGADTMRRLAAPMIGGLATGYFGVMLVFPIIYYLAQRFVLRERFQREAPSEALDAAAAASADS